MKTTIAKVIGKPSDYWVCPECGGLNWYENEACVVNTSIIECEGLYVEPLNSMEEELQKIEVCQDTHHKQAGH